MPRGSHARHNAAFALTVACAFWGFSFPVMKALQQSSERVLPGVSSWFAASAVVGGRFLLGALVLMLVDRTRATRDERSQGFAIGLATGVGMLLQTDALVYTDASIAAFLTQAYVFMLPLVTLARTRRLPPVRVLVCAALVVIGLAILARFDPHTLRLGRGEAETLLAAVCFTAQITLLDLPRFAKNQAGPVTRTMFLTMAALGLPLAFISARAPLDFVRLIQAPAFAGCFAFIVSVPTLASFLLMNRYQRALSASEAGIIYATEPVFTSALALFLPSWLSRVANIDYPDEVLSPRLLVGGSIVLVANVVLVLPQRGARY